VAKKTATSNHGDFDAKSWKGIPQERSLGELSIKWSIHENLRKQKKIGRKTPAKFEATTGKHPLDRMSLAQG